MIKCPSHNYIKQILILSLLFVEVLWNVFFIIEPAVMCLTLRLI